MGTVTNVLVANRGEIALRIMRTCRAMGLGTVAVFSDADRDAPHVRFADRAVRLGPAPARESYLVIERVIDAARRAGADAIHPGYGFLSEQAAFAEACVAAGLTFIGPSADVIRRLGPKREAKAIAVAAGVPVVPGDDGGDQSDGALTAAAARVGYPLLVKASAGGGGKGMRVVRGAGELAEALARARGEAAAAFGDATLILERYVESPRHVEVQLLGDHHGTVVALGERECSIQRRHQKVVEEAPSPTIDAATRAALLDAATRLGRAVGYTSAGTVEFIVAPDGAFYFLEVNTRLQVEHPVTEAVTGLDLVREQLRIARGERLGYDAAPPARGHAIEVRLYAEDADAGHAPAPGVALAVELAAPGVRVDAGLVAGGEVGVEYDPMIAKLIAHADTRAEATARLRAALERAWVPGLTTNRAYLARVLALPAFADAALHTHFLEAHAAALAPAPVPDDVVRVAATAAVLAVQHASMRAAPLPGVPAGWRNVPHGAHAAGAPTTFVVGARRVVTARRALGGGRVRVDVDGVVTEAVDVEVDGERVAFTDDGGERHACRVRLAHGARDEVVHWVYAHGHTLALREAPRFPPVGAAAEATGGLRAPMPGKVVKVLVQVGDAVAAGAPLVILEAMKMEHAVTAPHAGTVATLAVAVGDQVTGGQALATLDVAST